MQINNQRYAQLAGVNYDSDRIQPGPIVYSRTHTIVEQFDRLATFGECTLVTSFSDSSATQAMADKLPANVKCWWTNNMRCEHPRVKSLPIGCVYNVEREAVLEANLGHVLPRTNLVYMNFTRAVPRMPNPREGLYEHFGRYPWVTAKGGVSYASVTADQFYRDLRQHHYCLSPYGAGVDCHRTWEAMMLGCIPIVLAAKENEILDGMPALRVADWSHVTEETLINVLPEYASRFTEDNIKKLYFEYWRDQICST